VAGYTANTYEPDYQGLLSEAGTLMPLPPELKLEHIKDMEPKQVEQALIEHSVRMYEIREQEFGDEKMRFLERVLLLKTIDTLWVEHLTNMEYMRLQAGWQTLQQTRAADAYKNQGFKQFQLLLDTIRHDVAHAIFRMAVVKPGERQVKPPSGLRAFRPEAPGMTPLPGATGAGKPAVPAAKSGGKKVGRNEPCPCGSGRKYKHCCGG
jgi:preprotein translocase subunit SecA